VLTRRHTLKLGALTSFGAISGCDTNRAPLANAPPFQSSCPINFVPTFISPVFYGSRDYASPAVRVYYPSIAGSPSGAPILSNCERFPLVILIHGDCDPFGYNQWILLPSQLARAGYVVAQTSYGGSGATGPANGDPAQTLPLRQVHDWMRSNWEFRDSLMPAPHTAVVGHSFGATLGAQLISAAPLASAPPALAAAAPGTATLGSRSLGQIPAMAFASLSGTYGLIQASAMGPLTPTGLLNSLHVPSMFAWNTGDDDPHGAVLIRPGGASSLWSAIGTPKHAIIFGSNVMHGDYLTSGTGGTCTQSGSCNLVGPLAADFVTTFLAKYLPPEGDTTAHSLVPDSLIVRPQSLPAPPAQGVYAGAFMTGLSATHASQTTSEGNCVETVQWQTGGSTGSTFLVPS
jgi:hypothetical protein